MVWQPPSPPSKPAFFTLSYSDLFDFPLSLAEIRFWQIGKVHSLARLSDWPYRTGDYYHLKGRSYLVGIRQSRLKVSKDKFARATRVCRVISRFPTICAIFITGALAMHNSPPNDDIDIMLVVRPHTLWFTRIAIAGFLILTGQRRPTRLAEHSSPLVKDKICDNLYLDENHLQIEHLPIDQSPINQSTNLFLAHEILQAKCIFDRGGVHRQFLLANSWTKKYLPIAYAETINKFKNSKIEKLNENWKLKIAKLLLWSINLLLFIAQYLYMRHYLSREKIGLGYAFFHPRSYMVLLHGKWPKSPKQH